MESSPRTFAVFAGLIGALTLTFALLLLLAPAPLSPPVARSLFAIDQPAALDVVFETETAPETDRWSYIYIRHSRTLSGNAHTISQSNGGTLSDHFVITNGDGGVDGEIQMGHRWNQQLPAKPPQGASEIDPACISICLIGDFDQTVPTPTQLRRLAQLVGTLQHRFDIPADQILLADHPGTPAGIGRHFPVAAFGEQLLP